MRRAKILIVDDHPANLLALEATLAPLGHEVVRARGGAAAVRLATEDDFAVILLDVNMPGLDGLATAELLKGEPRSRHVPIIFLTASDPEAAMGSMLRAYESGAVDFLAKPFDPTILASKVSVFVELFLRGEAIVDKDASRRRAEALAERVSLLNALTSMLAEALTQRTIAEVTVHHGTRLLGADTCTLHVRGETGALTLVASHGLSDAWAEQVRLVEADAEMPAAIALRAGAPLWVESREEYSRRWPELARSGDQGGVRSFWSAPLGKKGNAVGILSMGFLADRSFSAEDRALVEAVARQCAHALERARLYEAERLANDRLRLVAEVSRVLSTSLDYETTLANLARSLAPGFADVCALAMVEGDESPRLVTVAARQDSEAQAVHAAWSSAEPSVLAALSSRTSRLFFDAGEPSSPLPALGASSAMLVPLVTRDRAIGVLALASASRRLGSGDLSLAEDVAARATLAVENARLHKDAREAIHLRDEFLAIASHELNTPLTPLKLQIGSLRRRAYPAEKVAEKLALADRQVDRLTTLVHQLLDVSRITAGRLELDRERLDLCVLVQEVTTRMEESASRTGSVVTFASCESAVGDWDRIRMDQIVGNLLGNAIKYGSGKPIDVSLRKDGARVVLAVRDHGIGIAPERQKRIFDRFERAVSSRNFGGFGLGLWIVRQVVDASGGAIAVESAPGEGSTFTVTLPISVPVARAG